jgi:hypothetical protein
MAANMTWVSIGFAGGIFLLSHLAHHHDSFAGLPISSAPPPIVQICEADPTKCDIDTIMDAAKPRPVTSPLVLKAAQDFAASQAAQGLPPLTEQE